MFNISMDRVIYDLLIYDGNYDNYIKVADLMDLDISNYRNPIIIRSVIISYLPIFIKKYEKKKEINEKKKEINEKNIKIIMR